MSYQASAEHRPVSVLKRSQGLSPSTVCGVSIGSHPLPVKLSLLTALICVRRGAWIWGLSAVRAQTHTCTRRQPCIHTHFHKYTHKHMYVRAHACPHRHAPAQTSTHIVMQERARPRCTRAHQKGRWQVTASPAPYCPHPGVALTLVCPTHHYNQFNRIVSSSNIQMMIAYRL